MSPSLSLQEIGDYLAMYDGTWGWLDGELRGFARAMRSGINRVQEPSVQSPGNSGLVIVDGATNAAGAHEPRVIVLFRGSRHTHGLAD